MTSANVIPLNRDQQNDFDAISAEDLSSKQFQPPAWVIPGVLPVGLTLLAGAPKSRKSWLVHDWCIAVGSGGLAMGSVHVPPARAVYFALEDNKARLQRRLHALTGTDKPPPFLRYVEQAPRIETGFCARLDRYLGANPGVKLVVIDTLAAVLSATDKADSYRSDYNIGKHFLPLCAKHQTAIVLVHHSTKAKYDNPIDVISGTRGLTGGVDNVFVLAKGECGLSLYMTGRDIEEERSLTLVLEPGTPKLVVAAAAPTAEPLEVKIWRAVKREGKLTLAAMLRNVDADPEAIKAALYKLEEEQIIVIDRHAGWLLVAKP